MVVWQIRESQGPGGLAWRVSEGKKILSRTNLEGILRQYRKTGKLTGKWEGEGAGVCLDPSTIWAPRVPTQPGVLTHTFRSQDSGGEGKKISVNSKAAWSTKWVLDQPGLHRKKPYYEKQQQQSGKLKLEMYSMWPHQGREAKRLANPSGQSSSSGLWGEIKV